MLYEGDRMIETVAAYFMRITVTAVLCGLFNSLTLKSSFSKMIQFLSGIILTLSLIMPLCSLKINDFYTHTTQFEAKANSAIIEGQDAAEKIMDKIIIEKTCAYIVDKAKSFGGDVMAIVTLEDHVPIQVMLSGSISPYGKTQLTTWIAEELEIPKEMQYWR